MKLSRDISQPRPGYFIMKEISGGVKVPARIWRPCACTPTGGDDQAIHDWRETCDRYPHLQGEISGRYCDLYRVWTGGTETTESHFRYMTDVQRWAATHALEDPHANPKEPIDLGAMPPLF